VAAVLRFRASPELFAVPVFCYGAVLAAGGGAARYILTGLIVAAHAIVYLLPWRVPRDDRTPIGYWFETLTCTLPLTAGAIGWLLLAPQGARGGLPTASPAALWLPAWGAIAIMAGLILVRRSGLDLRALRAGDLAFLSGPLSASRAAARTWAVVVAIVAEEVIFRGVPDGLMSYRPLALALGAVAFVSGHHMVRGARAQLRLPVVANEAGAAVLLGGLVVFSGSIWPAVIAHAIADLPHVALDVQRARPDQTDGEQWNDVVT
jgi:membrane protease YdiL (CAAX protease family)